MLGRELTTRPTLSKEKLKSFTKHFCESGHSQRGPGWFMHDRVNDFELPLGVEAYSHYPQKGGINILVQDGVTSRQC